MDWDAGNYERIATQLLPAARVVIDRAAPLQGERVLDIGCGTGNAAILAAERGARVTAVDPAQRLLDIGRAEAAARGVDVAFLRGEAARLPLPLRVPPRIATPCGGSTRGSVGSSHVPGRIPGPDPACAVAG
jgi:SAM-dependent methyltransferase